MKTRGINVLALDLEGTLISNAMSQIPRPGLFEFLTRCQELFPRLVMFTTVREPLFRNIAALLVKEGLAPGWFEHIEYVNWKGETKDLNFIPRVGHEDALLVDDFEKYVHPGQESHWLRIEQFASPYESTDKALVKMLRMLEQRAGVT